MVEDKKIKEFEDAIEELTEALKKFNPKTATKEEIEALKSLRDGIGGLENKLKPKKSKV